MQLRVRITENLQANWNLDMAGTQVANAYAVATLADIAR